MTTVFQAASFKRVGICSLLAIMMILSLIPACSRDPRISMPSATNDELRLMAEVDRLRVWAVSAEKQTAHDILDTLRSHSTEICAALQVSCEFDVVVEVYPDQASFDEHVMNPAMRGFFAISGSGHKIQMVSPANPAPHEISYADGVSVAVHEFVHLALDEVNPELPAWLDEGTAVYLGPHSPYTTVCQFAFPFEMMPSFRQLRDEYESVRAPDLFAYGAVDFIVHEHGMEKLNSLLREPDNLHGILGYLPPVFEEKWHRFMQDHYHDSRSYAIPGLGLS